MRHTWRDGVLAKLVSGKQWYHFRNSTCVKHFACLRTAVGPPNASSSVHDESSASRYRRVIPASAERSNYLPSSSYTAQYDRDSYLGEFYSSRRLTGQAATASQGYPAVSDNTRWNRSMRLTLIGDIIGLASFRVRIERETPLPVSYQVLALERNG
jgi:hypothetical protein